MYSIVPSRRILISSSMTRDLVNIFFLNGRFHQLGFFNENENEEIRLCTNFNSSWWKQFNLKYKKKIFWNLRLTWLIGRQTPSPHWKKWSGYNLPDLPAIIPSPGVYRPETLRKMENGSQLKFSEILWGTLPHRPPV